MRYVAEIDMASGNPAIRDLYIGSGEIVGDGEFRLGHLREPFSLEGGTSANSYSLMERSAINELDPARNWGLGYFRCSPDEVSTVAMGVFQSGTNSSDLKFGPGSETATTARWTMLPWYEDHGQRLIHVGVAVSERFPNNGIVVVK